MYLFGDDTSTNLITASDIITVSTITPTAAPTAILTPTACTPRPNIVRNVTVDNVQKIVNVTATVGTNASTPTNTLKSIKFTKITNATLEVPTNWTLTNPGNETPIYTFPANTTTVSFKEKRIACGAVTVEYTWIDDCGTFSDFSGAGTGSTGLTCDTTTPTNTPTPTGGSLATIFDVKAFLTGIGSPSGTFAPKRLTRQVIVDIFDKDNNEMGSKQGTITYASSSGSFVGTISLNTPCPKDTDPGTIRRCFPQEDITIPSGDYTIKIQTPQFLRKSVPGIITLNPNSTITLPPLTLITGDINSDNKINILDFNILTMCYGDKAETNGCTKEVFPEFGNLTGVEAADLNDDGVVDGIDYNLFIRSLATKEGD